MLDRSTDNPDPEAKGQVPLTWAFPTRVRCPREEGGCGSVQTVATSTQGRHQYRRCLLCGNCFKVIGWKV